MQYRFKNTSNESLLEKTKSLVNEERRLTSEVLWCLHEVEERLLFAEMGYSSLYEFTIRELGYSEGSAHRRISAMRLLKTLPVEEQKKTEEKLKEGTLSLTNVAMLQSFFKVEKKVSQKTYSVDEKIELLSAIEHQSKRETEKLLIQLQPAMESKEKERLVSNGREITFIADESLLSKLQEIKNLTAHRDSNPSYAKLIEQMADLMLQSLKKKRGIEQGSSRSTSTGEVKNEKPRMATVSNETPWPKNRIIPTVTKRQVWLRDQAKCTYRHPQTGKTCDSQFGLEIDHVRPFEMGGTHELNNLRLRCRAHNLLHFKRCS